MKLIVFISMSFLLGCNDPSLKREEESPAPIKSITDTNARTGDTLPVADSNRTRTVTH